MSVMTAQGQRQVDVSIVMPCLNEVRSLEPCLRAAREALQELDQLHGLHGEIVLADNGSTDGSQALAMRLGARVVPVSERGYGAALRGGFEAAHGRYLVMGDADGSYDFREAVPMVERLIEGASLCMGSRFKGGIKPGAMPWKNRYIGNPVLTGILNVFFRPGISDAHCGLRALTKDCFDRLGLTGGGMEFASEMVIKAVLRGERITEVPATLSPDLRDRPPHLRPWRDGWRHLRFLLLHSPRWTFVYPGLSLIGLGVLMVAILLPGRLALGEGVSLDIRAFLLGCLAIVLGVQSLTFGFIARRFAAVHDLLPKHRRAQRLLEEISMERLLQLAAVLALAGVSGLSYAIVIWAKQHFGPLDQGQMLRGMVLSVSAVVVAVQLGLSAFLLGVLDLKPGAAQAAQIRQGEGPGE